MVIAKEYLRFVKGAKKHNADMPIPLSTKEKLAFCKKQFKILHQFKIKDSEFYLGKEYTYLEWNNMKGEGHLNFNGRKLWKELMKCNRIIIKNRELYGMDEVERDTDLIKKVLRKELELDKPNIKWFDIQWKKYKRLMKEQEYDTFQK